MAKRSATKSADKAPDPVLNEQDIKDQALVDKILNEKSYYYKSSQGRRSVWAESWKMYMSWVDATRNPFLANLFIPKTHEAVELLAAFLSGPNQSIRADGEGPGDTRKGQIAEKYLDFMWRKSIKARDKVVTCIKQAIIFGNGFLKCGWDSDLGAPFLEVPNITDVFFDYFYRNIQDSPSVIHRVHRLVADVQEDERYEEKVKDAEGNETLIRSLVVSQSKIPTDDATEAAMASYDDTISSVSGSDDSTILLERWTKKEVITIGPTSLGWKILRRMDNPYKDSDDNTYIPFVKVRLKNNPLPNRGYDFGAIEPTIKIQKAFNDMMNEVFDNVSLINNKQWIKRKGASINPMDLIRRPGGIIEVDNIEQDIKSEEVGDIKQSAIEMLRILDSEFQQASMVVNLLKGVPGADTATEATIGQQNVESLLSLVDSNIKEAFSDAGQMVLDIALQYDSETNKTIKLIDNDEHAEIVEFDVKEIKGKYDVKITPERPNNTPTAVKQKQLLDLMGMILKDPETQAKYPALKVKVYKRWLENGGEGDPDYFFEEAQNAMNTAGGGGLLPPGIPGAGPTGTGLTSQALNASANAPAISPVKAY